MRQLIFTVCICLLSMPAVARSLPCEWPQDSSYTPLKEQTAKTVLYRIDSCDDSAPSYLFGTFHSDSLKLKPLFDKAISTFDVVDAVALEIVMTPQVQRLAQRGITLPREHPGLHTIIGETLWHTIKHEIAPMIRMEVAQADRMTPWGLAVLMQYPPAEADGNVLDVRIQKRAEAAKLRLFSLENIRDQFKLFQDLTLEQQIRFLTMSVNDIESLPEMQKQLTMLYLDQDLQGIYTLSHDLFEEMSEQDADLAHHLEYELIEKRNIGMADKIDHGRQIPTLYAVGSLHLPGKEGVLNLLEEKGYRLIPVE